MQSRAVSLWLISFSDSVVCPPAFKRFSKCIHLAQPFSSRTIVLVFERIAPAKRQDSTDPKSRTLRNVDSLSLCTSTISESNFKNWIRGRRATNMAFEMLISSAHTVSIGQEKYSRMASSLHLSRHATFRLLFISMYDSTGSHVRMHVVRSPCTHTCAKVALVFRR